MANSDKNIRITTSKNKTTYPNIVFTGSAAGSSVITLEVLDDNTLSFTSNEGQVFSIDSNLSTGTIWAVSDISGIPLLSASAGGTIGLGVYGGVVGIGQTNPTYKLDLKGSFGLASSADGLYNFIFSNSAASGSNSLQVRSANSLLLYNSGNTFYTGLKSNAAANVTYTLPTTDGSSGQFLQTNGSGTLSWATATGSGGTGSTAGVGQGGQYEMAFYPGTGLSVIGSNTFTNNTATGVVSITHSTVSTDFSNGAFKVTGGVGIGGSLYVGGIGASIVGVTFSNSSITRGTWNGTNISTTYGGTGQNLGSSTGILTISSGTVSASTTSSALLSALSDETGGGVLVFNSSPSFGTGVTTGDSTFAVFNTNATTINAFGAATAINFGASTGKATFNSTDNSTSSTTGGLVVSGGAGFAKSISIAGRLQLLNGANVTAFVSSGTGNTVYVLPATTPATGTSVLQSDSIGNLSWVGISSGSGSATTATNIQISALGNVNSFHPVLLTPFQASSGSAVSANGTVVYNPSTDIFYTPGLAVTSGVDSSSTTTGALQVRGGIGVTGTGYFDVVRTRAIVTTGDVTIAGNFAVNGTTIDFGNATTDSISFIGRVDTNILPISNNLYDLGSPTLAYANAAFGSSIYFTNTSNTNILAFTAGATGTTLTYVLPIDTPTAGQVLAASAISGGRVTLSWEDDQTGAPAGGITTLNTLTAASQSFSTGTSGSDFNISSVTSTHTFNIPDAGSSARGLVTTGTQTFAGAKTFSSAASITDATVSTSTSSGALVVTGGVGIGGSLFVANPARFSSSTAAISVGTGALTVTGGAGIAGSLYAGGVSAFTSNAVSISTGTGALVVTGGVGIGGSLYAGGISNFSSSTASLSVGTGALVVTGGVGIGGSLNVASPASISGVILNTNYISATGGTFTTILQAATIRALSGNTISFQTIDASNAAQFNNVRFAILYGTASSSSGTGALVVSGGAGVGGSLFVASASQFEASTAAISVGTGAVVVTGGVGIGGSLYAGGASRFTSSTAAVSSGTGALTVTGGAGIAGSLFVASASRFESSTASIDVGTGALTVTGGVGIGGSIYVGGASRFSDTTQSTTTNTGALVVTGGAAVGQTFSVGGSLNIFNGANYTGFRFTGSASTTYTLPPRTPTGTGTSFLSSSVDGVMAWVAAPSGGGGGSPSGSVGDVQYSSGTGSFSSSANFNWTNAVGMLKAIGYNSGSATNASLLVGENGTVNFSGSATGTLLALSNTSQNGAQYNFIDAQFDNGTPPSNLSVFKVDYLGRTQVADLTITSSSYATRTNNNKLVTSASQAVNLTYTLPLAYPSGTGTSYLSASTTGEMAWVAAPSGGSSGAGSGTVAIPGAQYQVAAYYHSASGASVSGSSTFTNNTATGVVEITHTTESTSTTSGALQVDGGAGIAKSLFVGTTLSVGTTPSYNIPNNLASFVSTVNSYNQLVIQNKSNGTSASANLVVNNDVSTDAANYGEIGMNSSTFSGSGALSAPNAVYVASATAPLVLGTTTAHPIRFVVNNGATDMLYISESGTAISCFANFGLRNASDLRFWNSGNTFYAGIQGGSTSANYLLTMPTAPVGAGLSAILVDTAGNMYFAPLEGGLAVTSATGNRAVIRNRMEHHVWMAAGYTPLAAGADNIIYVIPDSSEDGSTKVTFRLTEFTIRVETPSAGSSRIQLERSSTDTGAFTLAATGSSLIGGSGLTIAGAGIYVTSTNTFAAGTFVTSGNLLRLNWTLLNATHANFSVQFTLNEV